MLSVIVRRRGALGDVTKEQSAAVFWVCRVNSPKGLPWLTEMLSSSLRKAIRALEDLIRSNPWSCMRACRASLSLPVQVSITLAAIVA